MKHYIKCTMEQRKCLLGKYNINRQVLWEALCFITKSARAQKIREDALSMGGRYIEENFIPNCKTEHKNGILIQTFAGGVSVVTKTEQTEIRVEDEVVAKFKDVTIATWGNVLAKAQEISQKRVFNN